MKTDKKSELECLNDYLRSLADADIGIRRKMVLLNRVLQSLKMKKNNGYFLISENGSVGYITPEIQQEIDMEILRMVREKQAWKK